MLKTDETRKIAQKIVAWDGMDFLHTLWTRKGRYFVLSTNLTERTENRLDFGHDRIEAHLYYEKITR